jgi:hypothetical protein
VAPRRSSSAESHRSPGWTAMRTCRHALYPASDSTGRSEAVMHPTVPTGRAMCSSQPNG